MQIEIPDDRDLQKQAVAAGFANLEEYVVTLLDRDAERVALQTGVSAMKAGRMKSFDEFDAEFRERNGLTPHP